jgi:hypothetical protein
MNIPGDQIKSIESYFTDKANIINMTEKKSSKKNNIFG